jgi:hypothetical protein
LGRGVIFAPAKWLGGVACPPETFRNYVERNLSRDLPEIALTEAHDNPLYIAASGPTLRETHLGLEGKDNIWALNNAHDYLLRQGIAPTFGVAHAPEYQVLDYFKDVREGSQYLFASCTHPDLIDYVLDKGGKVTLWNSDCPEDWGVDFRGRSTIFGGGTIGLRSLDLAWVLGYRDVHLLGLDACISDDGRIGPDLPLYEDRRKDILVFMCNGRAFRALPGYARQVEDFGRTVRPLTGMSITMYGDGMLQWSQRGHS